MAAAKKKTARGRMQDRARVTALPCLSCASSNIIDRHHPPPGIECRHFVSGDPSNNVSEILCAYRIQQVRPSKTVG
jgi:hypothetical protein